MKKSLALLLALAMLIGVLAGCSANTDTTTADSTTAAETAEPADIPHLDSDSLESMYGLTYIPTNLLDLSLYGL